MDSMVSISFWGIYRSCMYQIFSSSYIRDIRCLVDRQLSTSLPQQKLNSGKVLLVCVDALLEFASGEGFEVRSRLGRLRASGAQATTVEGEDIPLKAGETLDSCHWMDDQVVLQVHDDSRREEVRGG